MEAYSDLESTEDSMAMKAYLKNKFQFIGIRMPERRALSKSFFKEHGKPKHNELSEIVKVLYSKEQREYHYLAMDIAGFFKKKWIESDLLIIEHMIEKNQWWDSVDFIAVHLVGSYLRKFPELKTELNERYINHENMWFRRVAILFQLKYKEEVDLIMLEENILKCNREKEFFIEKAIGWILREYSKTNPNWVKSLIERTPLRPLSIREGSKYLN